MSKLSKPTKCKLFFGLIYSSGKIYKNVRGALVKKYGALDFESQPLDFDFTEYYREEMGSNLKRRFISLKKLINPTDIVEIKLFAVKLEKRYSILKKRRINIDPGYLNDAKLILSTTKDFSHRIYLGKKIFAEVTQIYKKRKFNNLPWTFPDYRTRVYKDIFLKIRNLYKEQIKKLMPK